jgi:hypothetical protein
MLNGDEPWDYREANMYNKGKKVDRFFIHIFFVFPQDKSGGNILTKEFRESNILI